MKSVVPSMEIETYNGQGAAGKDMERSTKQKQYNNNGSAWTG